KQDAQRVEELTASVTRDLERGEFLRKLEGFTERFGDVVIGPDGELSESAFTDKLNAIGYGRVKGLPGVDEKVDQLRQQLSAPAAQIAPLEAPPVELQAQPLLAPELPLQAQQPQGLSIRQKGEQLRQEAQITEAPLYRPAAVTRNFGKEFLQKAHEFADKNLGTINAIEKAVVKLSPQGRLAVMQALQANVEILANKTADPKAREAALADIEAAIKSALSTGGLDEEAAREISAIRDQIIEKLKTAKDAGSEEILNAILPVVFAITRDASKDRTDKRHYNSQVRAGIGLHLGTIAKLLTGEGKTLTAALPASLNALTRQVHIHVRGFFYALEAAKDTVPIFSALGYRTGIISKNPNETGFLIVNDKDEVELVRADIKDVYSKCRIIYGTDFDYGFDHLKSAAAQDASEQAQPDLRRAFAIVDEADAVFIDEAGTPQILSSPSDMNPEELRIFRGRIKMADRLIADLIKSQPAEGEYYKVKTEDGAKRVEFTEKGMDFINSALSKAGVISEGADIFGSGKLDDVMLVQMVDNALRIHTVMEKGADYILTMGLDDIMQTLGATKETLIRDLGTALRSSEKDPQALNRKLAALQSGIVDVEDVITLLNIETNKQEPLRKSAKVTIVSGYTGRQAEGSRWSDGLHEAAEAKEGVEIGEPSRTLGTVTRQRFYSQYGKLSGMTGTPGEAEAKSGYYDRFYSLSVFEADSNTAVQRQEMPDKVLATKFEKWQAIINDIISRREGEASLNPGKERPILLGGNISVSEAQALGALFNGEFIDGGAASQSELAEMLGITGAQAGILQNILSGKGIHVNVLDASLKGQEAEIISGAGQFGAVTIATSMAGRGTDIKVPADVLKAGGLHIMGGTRSESKRIDDQFAGRGGRQGNAASVQFYVSLEDDAIAKNAVTGDIDYIKRLIKDKDYAAARNEIDRIQRRAEASALNAKVNNADYDLAFNIQLDALDRLRQALLDNSGAPLFKFGLFGAEHEIEKNLVEFITGIGLDPNELIRDIARQVQESDPDMEDDEAVFAAKRILMKAIDRHRASYGDEKTKPELMELARTEAKNLAQQPTERDILAVYRNMLRDTFGNMFKDVIAESMDEAKNVNFATDYAEQFAAATSARQANTEAGLVVTGEILKAVQVDRESLSHQELDRFNAIGLGVVTALSKVITGLDENDRVEVAGRIAFSLLQNPTMLKNYFDFDSGKFDAAAFGEAIVSVFNQINPHCEKQDAAANMILNLFMSDALSGQYLLVDKGQIRVKNPARLVKLLSGRAENEVSALDLTEETASALYGKGSIWLDVASPFGAKEAGLRDTPVSYGVYEASAGNKTRRVLVVRIRRGAAGSPDKVRAHFENFIKGLSGIEEVVVAVDSDATEAGDVEAADYFARKAQGIKNIKRVSLVRPSVEGVSIEGVAKTEKTTASQRVKRARSALAKFGGVLSRAYSSARLEVRYFLSQIAAGTPKFVSGRKGWSQVAHVTVQLGVPGAAVAGVNSMIQNQVLQQQEEFKAQETGLIQQLASLGKDTQDPVEYAKKSNAILQQYRGLLVQAMQKFTPKQQVFGQEDAVTKSLSERIRAVDATIAQNDKMAQGVLAQRSLADFSQKQTALKAQMSDLQAQYGKGQITQVEYYAKSQEVLADLQTSLESVIPLIPSGTDVADKISQQLVAVRGLRASTAAEAMKMQERPPVSIPGPLGIVAQAVVISTIGAMDAKAEAPAAQKAAEVPVTPAQVVVPAKTAAGAPPPLPQEKETVEAPKAPAPVAPVRAKEEAKTPAEAIKNFSVSTGTRISAFVYAPDKIKNPDAYFEKLSRTGISRVYINLHKLWQAERGLSVSGTEDIKNIIKAAAKHGIELVPVVGNAYDKQNPGDSPDWTSKLEGEVGGAEWYFGHFMDALDRINAELPEGQKLRNVAVDIEPHTHPSWNTDMSQNAPAINRYIGLRDRLQNLLAKRGYKLAVTFEPHFYSVYKDEKTGEEKTVDEYKPFTAGQTNFMPVSRNVNFVKEVIGPDMNKISQDKASAGIVVETVSYEPSGFTVQHLGGIPAYMRELKKAFGDTCGEMCIHGEENMDAVLDGLIMPEEEKLPVPREFVVTPQPAVGQPVAPATPLPQKEQVEKPAQAAPSATADEVKKQIADTENQIKE
ncbi:MAG: hypothetical protein ABH825_04505, partial [Candidatus Omnitrophota bacterium]